MTQTLREAKASFDEAHANGKKFERVALFDSLSSLFKKQTHSESIDIITAGSDTTATTLGYLINSVLANPDILRKLRAELDAGLPDKKANWPLLELERFEYQVSNTSSMVEISPRRLDCLYQGDSSLWIASSRTPSANRSLSTARCFTVCS